MQALKRDMFFFLLAFQGAIEFYQIDNEILLPVGNQYLKYQEMVMMEKKLFLNVDDMLMLKTIMIKKIFSWFWKPIVLKIKR